MKMAGINHPKTLRLQARLNLAKWQAVGVLETMFNFTAQYCPDGFIGKWKNEEIAVFLDWKDDPDELFAALVESEWLEFDEDGLLYVHDWNDHKPKYVKDRETKANKRLNKPAGVASPTNSAASASPQAKPSQAKPSQLKTNKPDLFEERFEELKKRWDETPGTKPVNRVTQARLKKARARLNDPEWSEDYPKALAKFPLEVSKGEGAWKPDFNWFLRPESVNKTIEGLYDFRPNGQGPAPPPPRKPKSPRVVELETRRMELTAQIRKLTKQGAGTTVQAEELKQVLETIEKELA